MNERDRQTDRQTETQRDRERQRETHTNTETETDRQKNRQADRRQADRRWGINTIQYPPEFRVLAVLFISQTKLEHDDEQPRQSLTDSFVPTGGLFGTGRKWKKKLYSSRNEWDGRSIHL